MERYLAIGKETIRYHLIWQVLISIGILCAAPLVLGVRNLNIQETARVVEYYAVFPGIVLLVPIFLPEQNRDIRDLIRSKYTAVGAIYGIRLVLSIVVMMAVSALFLYALKIGECEFPFDTFYPGLLAGMVFLGGLGLLSYALCDNVVVGYMMPLLFYIVSMASGEKYLGKFYLFSMGTGSYEEKWYLALAGMLFLGVGIAVRSRKES